MKDAVPTVRSARVSFDTSANRAKPKSMMGCVPRARSGFGGLDIAMHDALDVRRLQALRNLAAEVESIFERQRSRGNAVFQCLALQESHRKEGLAVGFSNLVNRADVGVVEGRRSFGISQEALLGFVVV